MGMIGFLKYVVGMILLLGVLGVFDVVVFDVIEYWEGVILIYSDLLDVLVVLVWLCIIEMFFVVYVCEWVDFYFGVLVQVCIVIDLGYDGIVYVGEKEKVVIIIINLVWLVKYFDDIDLVMYEVMYIVQGYLEYVNECVLGWLVEGIVDYVCDCYGSDNVVVGWVLLMMVKDGQNVEIGYWVIGVFLKWGEV